MTELSENIVKEIDDMMTSLDGAKEEFKKKFDNMMEDMLDEAWNKFTYFIESDSRYCLERWVRQTSEEIVMGLLSGDTRWLKYQSIISEYTWDKVQKVRLAIWEAAGGEIANSTISALQLKVFELEKENKSLRNRYSNNY